MSIPINNGPALRPRIDRIGRRALVVGVIGIAACIAGIFLSPGEFLHAYLWSYLFVLGIALGSSAILMMYYLTGGKWGDATQRLLEAGSRTLPLVAVLTLPLLFGVHRLYLWAQPAAVAADPQLQKKAVYLNVPFFIGRTVIYFAIWLLWAWMLNRFSRERDRGNPTMLGRLTTISGPGLFIYGISMSFAAVDWVMSLEPHWFSTIYGAIYLIGQGLSALSVALVVVLILAEHGVFPEPISVKAVHDLGNLLLAFVVLWAYVAFSQLLIIWSGNLPHDITWYYRRFHGGWQWIGLMLIFFHFLVPFFLLLLRSNKRRPDRLIWLAAWLIFMRVADLFWMVQPAFRKEIAFTWLDAAAFAALGGVWLSVYTRQLRTGPLLAVPVPTERP